MFSFYFSQDDVLDLDWSVQFATLMVSKWDLVFVRVKCTSHLTRRSFFGNQKRTAFIFRYLNNFYERHLVLSSLRYNFFTYC